MEFYLFPFYTSSIKRTFADKFLKNSDPDIPWCVAYKDEHLHVTQAEFDAYTLNLKRSFSRAYLWLVFLLPTIAVTVYYFFQNSHTPIFFIISLVVNVIIYKNAVAAVYSAYSLPDDHWVLTSNPKVTLSERIDEQITSRWEFHYPGIVFLGYFIGGLGLMQLRVRGELLAKPVETVLCAAFVATAIGAQIFEKRRRKFREAKEAEEKANAEIQAVLEKEKMIEKKRVKKEKKLKKKSKKKSSKGKS